jgi:Flp pilus assembly pilin Flp
MLTNLTLTCIVARFRDFQRDQSGAVTVDWVVISAAVIAMVIGFFAVFTSDMGTATTNLMTMINSKI